MMFRIHSLIKYASGNQEGVSELVTHFEDENGKELADEAVQHNLDAHISYHNKMIEERVKSTSNP